ncbi:hypothetical protein GQ457_10G003330 [Hibiscus cannabinus]
MCLSPVTGDGAITLWHSKFFSKANYNSLKLNTSYVLRHPNILRLYEYFYDQYVASLARALVYCHGKHEPENLLIGVQVIPNLWLCLVGYPMKNASVDIWSLGVLCYEFPLLENCWKINDE